MKRLIIVRHGAYEHRSPFVADIDCPLSRQGRREVSGAGERLVDLQITPDQVISSPALRTSETAEILIKKMALNSAILQVDEGIYEAGRSEILRRVHSLDPSTEIVMLVGHDPAMTELVHFLLDSEIEKLPPASFVVLDLAVDQWRQISFENSELAHFYAPKVKDEHSGWWWRFTFWRRQKVQKIELFIVFFVVLLLILGLIAVIVQFSTDPSGMPQQGSMGR